MKALETPILFLVFNRPDTTRKVFERIREVRPKYLYVAADGPRPGNDSDTKNTAEVREIFKSIDWDCKLITLYREENMGCKLAVSRGITWFFEQVEEGIILEDDVLPNKSFFSFCSRMLYLFRNDIKVMHISGFNILGKWKENKQGFHACYFGNVWGWASWARAWKFYDVNLDEWSNADYQQSILDYFPENMRSAKRHLYNDLYEGRIDTWDYQWTISRLLNNGLSIVPSKNLIKNIGFDKDATHTVTEPHWFKSKTYKLKLPDSLSGKIVIDKQYDSLHLAVNESQSPKSLLQKAFNKISNLVG
jgi:hypothetical protein